MRSSEINILRFLIREMISGSEKLTNNSYKKRLAHVLNQIAAVTDGIFKLGGSKDRLTLVDKSSRPFQGMSAEELDQKLSGFVRKAGYEIENVLMPGEGLSRSFDTYKIYEEGSDQKERRHYFVVFGTSFSNAEASQFISIDQDVKKLSNNRQNPIEVFDGSKYVMIDDATRVGGRGRKPDVILTLDGDTKLSISLKNLPTGSPTEMQQWGGLVKFKNHPEVISFIECVKSSLEDPENTIKRFYRKIEDEDLKEKMVWGVGGDQVDVIVAGGIPVLVPSQDKPGAFEIAFRGNGRGHILYRSRNDHLPSEFEPVLFARPASDRGFGGLSNYRVVAFPLRAAQTSGTRDMCSVEP